MLDELKAKACLNKSNHETHIQIYPVVSVLSYSPDQNIYVYAHSSSLIRDRVYTTNSALAGDLGAAGVWMN